MHCHIYDALYQCSISKILSVSGYRKYYRNDCNHPITTILTKLYKSAIPNNPFHIILLK